MGGNGARSGLKGGGGGAAQQKPLASLRGTDLYNYMEQNYGRDIADVGMFFYRAYGENVTSEVMDALKKAPEELRVMYGYAAQEGLLEARALESGHSRGSAYFNPSTGAVHINIKDSSHVSRSDETRYEVLFHEYAHLIDYKAAYMFGKTRLSEGLTEVIKKDYIALKDKAISLAIKKMKVADEVELIARTHTLNKASRKWSTQEFEAQMIKSHLLGKYGYATLASGNLSDIVEGAGAFFGATTANTERPLGVGHGAYYWMWTGHLQAAETFAEISSSLAKNPASLAAIKDVFPNTYNEYEKIIGEVAQQWKPRLK